jgi:hypothetical protein
MGNTDRQQSKKDRQKERSGRTLEQQKEGQTDLARHGSVGRLVQRPDWNLPPLPTPRIDQALVVDRASLGSLPHRPVRKRRPATFACCELH